MKKGIITLVLAVIATGTLFAAMHHYGFILSCGKTIYQSFDRELADNEILEYSDFYESIHCQLKTSHDPIYY